MARDELDRYIEEYIRGERRRYRRIIAVLLVLLVGLAGTTAWFYVQDADPFNLAAFSTGLPWVGDERQVQGEVRVEIVDGELVMRTNTAPAAPARIRIENGDGRRYTVTVAGVRQEVAERSVETIPVEVPGTYTLLVQETGDQVLFTVQ